MRKLYTMVIFCFFIFTSFAQDVIYKKNGGKIEGKIIEITIESLKYKAIDHMDGPTRNIPLYEVYMIKYGNGKEEFFNKENPKGKRKERFFSNKKNRYFLSVATGFGQSYGGIGIRLQGRIGRILGFGYHAGVGYFPAINNLKPAVWGSIGCKFFWYKAWYLNVQFGSTAQYKYRNKYGTAYGPSVLIGGDWFFNKWIGMNGAIGGAFNVTQPHVETAFVTVDIGFIVKFSN